MANNKNNKSKQTSTKRQNCNSRGNYDSSRKGKCSRNRNNYVPDDKFDASTATNNPAWYGADPAILRDSASLPFSFPVGTPLNLHNPALVTLESGQEFTIPGFMTLYTMPSVGWANDPSDPINVAAFRAYTFVRHMNAGHTNYDAPDLMIYLLAMTQVYSYINFLQRAYGIVYTYAQKNRYLPDALLKSMGIDSDDVRNNLAQFRYGINVLINKAASLCVPSTMAIFAQQASLYQNIYIEGDSIKDQMYLYSPKGFWWYNLNTDASGMLEYHGFYGSDYRTVANLLEFGSSMLARLIQSEDMNIMSGDIRKAYGDASLIKLVPLNVDFPISPIKDVAVLQQMKNTIVVPINDGFNVVQDSTHGFLVHKPAYTFNVTNVTWDTKATIYASQTYCEDKILSVYSTDPTPEEVMETTRNMPLITAFSKAEDWKTAKFEVHPCTVIVAECKVWDFKVENQNPILRGTSYHYTKTILVENADAVAGNLRLSALLSHFKYHPVVHLMAVKQGAAAGSFNITDGYLMYDVDNYTIVDGTTLERMHEAALLSMLNVPTVTKVQ